MTELDYADRLLRLHMRHDDATKYDSHKDATKYDTMQCVRECVCECEGGTEGGREGGRGV